jgi:hypothetical protein
MTAFPSDNRIDQDFIVVYLNGVIERFNTVTGDVVWKTNFPGWVDGPNIFSAILEIAVTDDAIILHYYRFIDTGYIDRESNIQRYVNLNPVTGNVVKMRDIVFNIHNFDEIVLDYDQTTGTFLIGSSPMKWVDFNFNIVKVEEFVPEFGFVPPTKLGTEVHQASHRLIGYDRITKCAIWHNDKENISCISQVNGGYMVNLHGTSVISDFGDYLALSAIHFSQKYMWWIKLNRFNPVTGNHEPEIKRCDWPCDCDTKPASSHF